MNKMTNYTKNLCNRHLENTLDNYNFECDGRSDTNKIYYSVKNGIDQIHLITFDEPNKVVIHKVLDDNGNLKFEKTYTSIDELTDNLNDWSGGVII